ncbi:MAG: hypothetical protein IJY27_06655 [Clostridia bacterium]|nr:hypothetical protein [Clostridia bacterium]
MTKNVIVVDEQGNEYEATYPKRAMGLVKNGRARFVDDTHTKICLACPPNENLEDKKMSENIITTAVENENTQEITAKYFLDQIEKIREDNKHVYDAIAGLSVMQTGAGDFGAAEQAQALASVVQSRETTNQQMIDFYTRAYEECLANDEARRDKKIQQVQQIWLSYLDHVASTIADEESVWQTKSNVESQINLLVMDILEDKIK